ncbi:MAG: hypothetical protein ACHQ9S_19175 [Candidatus Binatia bacterium]
MVSIVSGLSDNKGALEAQVATLAHGLAEAINSCSPEGREGLREDAVNILRDEVDISRPPVEAVASAAGAFNPFGIGIPLIMMGTVLVFLFPPVGLLMFAVAGVVIAWGVGVTLLTRR